MSALAWRRRPGHAASRPEPSATTARHLRRHLAAVLLALPLAAVAAPTLAIAQTEPVTGYFVSLGGTVLPEGADVTFNSVLERHFDRTETHKLELVIGGTATRGTDYRIVCIESAPAGAATCNDINGDTPSITFDGAKMIRNGNPTRRITGPLRLETIEDGDWKDETVTLQLGGGTTRTFTITDAPHSVEVTFATDTYSISEGDRFFQPVMRLDKAAGRDFVLPLTYANMTATSGTDYTALSGVTIPADGKLTVTFDIPVNDDNIHEGNESFRVGIDLSRLPAGVTMGSTPYATVTIRDDDPDPGPPGLVFDNAQLSWNENQGCGEFEYYDPSGNKIAGNTAEARRRNALAVYAPVQSGNLTSPGASMELPATAPGPSYRVRLKTRPQIPVKVTVYDPNDLTWWGNNRSRTLSRVFVGPDRGAANGRNGVGKPTLTFTPENWNQWQTVKVKVACTDHFPDAVPLQHRVEAKSNGGTGTIHAYSGYKNFNDQRWTVWVRVQEKTPPMEIVASGLPPAGQTITMAEGDTRDFRIRIGEAMLPSGSSGSVAVHLFTEPVGNVIGVTRRDGTPHVDGITGDTMTFTSSNREQWVRLRAVSAGETRLVVSAERDFSWGHETQRHWSPEWPVRVELPGICGRTKAVRDALVRKISGVSNCRDVTPEHLAAVTGTLDLNRTNLSSLQTGDFRGLTKLEWLRLDDNRIASLPAGIFDDLKALSRLELDRNGLTTLRPGVFDKLTSLRTLELYRNPIAPLPAGIFDQLADLSQLDLDEIGLTTLPADMFDPNTKLTLLYLQDNELQALPANVFHKHKNLRSLRLSGNPGALFRPTADAGPAQTVSTGAQVTLSGTATGPWGDNVKFEWQQVDGARSEDAVTPGVTLSSDEIAAPTFTAPAAPTVLHFRLDTRPSVFDSLKFAGVGNSVDWVTITVTGGQGSPAQEVEAAHVEAPSCVSDALLADVHEYAGETWRTSPGHVARWSRVLAAFGVDNAYRSNPMTVAEAEAQADRGLQRWAPVVPALTCLAAAPEEVAPEEQPEPAEVQPATPATPALSLSAGSAVDEGGTATFTVTADPAPQSDLTIAWTVAQSGDYLAAPGAGSRTVVLTAGTTRADLTVATVDDAADEADGSVSVTLGAATGYTVATGSAAVAVRDNDEPVVRIAAGSGVVEGASASFTVSASPVPAAPLAVTLSVGQSGDFAASGETGSRTVTIPVAGSATFAVATVDDGTEEPDGSITATVAAGTGYAVAAAPDHAATVAVSDNDAASSGPTISIADAALQENRSTGNFKVTLSEPVDWPVAVHYATRDSTPVSAVAGQDYLAWKRSWRLRARFRPGQTETLIHVRLYNDSHDEGPETFEMVLFDASVNGPPGVSVSIADGVAVGTITNSDPMPAAWLARFGRTTAEQALDGIAGRIAASRSAGVQGSFAGQALNLDSGSGSGAASDHSIPGSLAGDDLLVQSGVARAIGPGSGPAFGLDARGVGKDRFGGIGVQSRSMTGREVLLGSNFTATGETDATGGSLAFWGRAAQSSFDGREGTFSLDGESTAAMLGADYARGNWLLGVALLQSSGEGGYADRKSGPQNCPDAGEGMDADMLAHLCGGAVREGDGKVEASLTAAVPYTAVRVSKRMKLWGALGHGTGEVELKPKMGGALTSDISWTMAAGGLRGDVIAPPAAGSGAALAITSDALWARTSSDRTRVLAASDSDVTRLRLGLEGSWRSALAEGGHVTPKLELGMRHDGGDAETGFGVEVGGGLAWEDPTLGLSLDLSGRTLITHDADDLKDRGFAASLAFDPEPASDRGLSLGLRQDWGGQANGGLDALFRADPLADRTGSSEPTSRWAAEAAYGFPAFSGLFTGSPHGGLGLATGVRDYSLGWRLAPAANANAPDVSFGVLATRRESDWTEPEHTAGFEAIARW